jgi:hypothetical protein
MHIDATIKGRELAAKSRLCQLVACDYPAGILEQNFQKSEFDRREFHCIAQNRQRAVAGIHLDFPDYDVLGARVVLILRHVGAAQDRTHAGDEFTGIKWFRQVIVSAEFQSQDPVDIFSASGEQKYRQPSLDTQFLEYL